MSTAARLAGSAAALASIVALSACGPPSTGTIGVGVDAAGRPVGYLKVCDGEHMDGAVLYAEPNPDIDRPAGSWDVRPAATGWTSWSLDRPQAGWVTRLAALLRPHVVYNLQAGANDGSGSSGYVLFTLQDLKTMKPGQVRTYDYTRPAPAGEPTGSPKQQAEDENSQFMHVISEHDFAKTPCLR